MGPAWDHYECLQFYIPSKGGKRTTGQYKIYPTHFNVPRETPMDKAVKIASNLTSEIRDRQQAPGEALGRHGEALSKLASIFEEAT